MYFTVLLPTTNLLIFNALIKATSNDDGLTDQAIEPPTPCIVCWQCLFCRFGWLGQGVGGCGDGRLAG